MIEKDDIILAIVVVCVIIGIVLLIFLFVVSLPTYTDLHLKPINISYEEKVCMNLDNGHAVFPEVMQRKRDIEDSLKMNIINIYGNETKARMWDKEGVMCNIGGEICHPDYLFCFHITMVVPINYTLWEQWYYNETVG